MAELEEDEYEEDLDDNDDDDEMAELEEDEYEDELVEDDETAELEEDEYEDDLDDNEDDNWDDNWDEDDDNWDEETDLNSLGETKELVPKPPKLVLNAKKESETNEKRALVEGDLEDDESAELEEDEYEDDVDDAETAVLEEDEYEDDVDDAKTAELEEDEYEDDLEDEETAELEDDEYEDNLEDEETAVLEEDEYEDDLEDEETAELEEDEYEDDVDDAETAELEEDEYEDDLEDEETAELEEDEYEDDLEDEETAELEEDEYEDDLEDEETAELEEDEYEDDLEDEETAELEEDEYEDDLEDEEIAELEDDEYEDDVDDTDTADLDANLTNKESLNTWNEEEDDIDENIGVDMNERKSWDFDIFEEIEAPKEKKKATTSQSDEIVEELNFEQDYGLLNVEDSYEPEFLIPFTQNKNFIGRTELLNKLFETKQKNISKATFINTLKGVVGVGKTQLAIEYAYKYQEKYENIYWIDASSSKKIANSINEILDTTDLKKINTKKYLNKIAKEKNWLLIIDNLQSTKNIFDLIPKKNGHCIITTQLNFSSSLGDVYHIPEFNDQEIKEAFEHHNIKLSSRDLYRVKKSTNSIPLPIIQQIETMLRNNLSFDDYYKQKNPIESTTLYYKDSIDTKIKAIVKKLNSPTKKFLKIASIFNDIDILKVLINEDYLNNPNNPFFELKSSVPDIIENLNSLSLISSTHTHIKIFKKSLTETPTLAKSEKQKIIKNLCLLIIKIYNDASHNTLESKQLRNNLIPFFNYCYEFISNKTNKTHKDIQFIATFIDISIEFKNYSSAQDLIELNFEFIKKREKLNQDLLDNHIQSIILYSKTNQLSLVEKKFKLARNLVEILPVSKQTYYATYIDYLENTLVNIDSRFNFVVSVNCEKSLHLLSKESDSLKNLNSSNAVDCFNEMTVIYPDFQPLKKENQIPYAYFCSNFATVCHHSGNTDKGLALINEAIEIFESFEDFFLEAHMHCIFLKIKINQKKDY